MRASRIAGSGPPLPIVLAWRFLAGHKSRLLDGTARAALLATGLGVTAMVIAMALMTGYSEDLQAKLIGDNAAVGAYPLRTAAPLAAEKLAALAALPGVERVSRVAYGQGLLATGQGDAVEVTLRGVDPAASHQARPEQLAPSRVGTAETKGDSGAGASVPGAVLGVELGKKLGVAEGEVLRMTALGFGDGRPRFRYQSLVVTGTFSSGLSEFDSSWVVLDRAVVERLVGEEPGTQLYEFALEDPALATEVAARAEEILGPEYVVTDWRQLNRELFQALALQKLVLFFGMGLIVLVSVFHVASTLVILVRERLRDVGALGAMGLAPGKLATVFVLCGAFLGGAGTLLGVALGSATAWVLTTFKVIRFNAEVAAIYFIDYVPFRVRLRDLGAIVTFSLLLTLLACVLPALRAARVQPAVALRYE